MKTFQEVIQDIKQGEIWTAVDDGLRIKKIYLTKYNTLMLEGGEMFSIDNSTAIGLNQIFRLQREKHSFTEAFKAYEQGKKMTSIFSEKEYKQGERHGFITFDEIRGDWYID